MTLGRSLLFAFWFLLPVTPLSAQALWPRPLEGKGELGLEWVRPTLATDDGDYGFGRGIWILDGRLRLKPRLSLVAAIPWIEASGGDGGESDLGNVMLGLQFNDTVGRPEFTLGLRHGGAGESYYDSGIYDVGVAADIDRIEQVFPQGLMIEGVGYIRPKPGEDGTRAEIRLGATGVIVGNETGGGGTFFIKYGLRVAHAFKPVDVGLGLTGIWLIANGFGPQSTIDQAFVDLTALKGRVRPSLAFRLPLDQYLDDQIDFAVNVGVRIPLD